jgi:hypothetical protein
MRAFFFLVLDRRPFLAAVDLGEGFSVHLVSSSHVDVALIILPVVSKLAFAFALVGAWASAAGWSVLSAVALARMASPLAVSGDVSSSCAVEAPDSSFPALAAHVKLFVDVVSGTAVVI